MIVIPDQMTIGLVPTRWSVMEEYDGFEQIGIIRTTRMSEPAKYAVTLGTNHHYNKRTGNFSYDGFPSGKEDDWYLHHRFDDFDEAHRVAVEQAQKCQDAWLRDELEEQEKEGQE